MDFVTIKGTTFNMGTDDSIGFLEDYEGPVTKVTIPSFQIATTTVTNRDFAQFVAETGYVTLAEKISNSFVFAGLLPEEAKTEYGHTPGAPWWLIVPGANWSHPLGPESSISEILDYPVVHVALVDALAFCQWNGSTLPTEAEWEYAAGQGEGSTYPWGNELVDDKGFHANTWQGEFPWVNDAADGYIGLAPVKSFEQNKLGLWQMIGNVWEWSRNPRGVMLDEFNDNNFSIDHDNLKGEYSIRGGSFLCHCSYCNRYRTAARNGVDCESTSSHLSFRVVKELSAVGSQE